MLENTEELAHFSPDAEQDMDTITYAKNCLLLFIQENITGPPLSRSYGESESLEIQGEHLVEYVKSSALLEKASRILYASSESSLWTARCAFVHQQVLTHPVEYLKDLAFSKYAKLISESSESSDLPFYCLEYALCLVYYSDYDRAEESLKQAQSLAGLSLNLTGKLGVRTKFQESKTAQLVLEASNTKAEEQTPYTPPVQAVALEQESEMLESPILEGGEEFESLKILDQLIILGWVHFFFKTKPIDELQSEIIGAYLEKILHKSSDWLVYSGALLFRSKNQLNNFRFRERSVLQLEQLVEQYSDSSPTARLTYYFALAYPPRHWLMEDLGQVFMKMGAVMSAFQLFERVGMWEEAIECLVAGNHKTRAKELAQTRLEIEHSPRILCSLGDITKDPSYYYQAWELSGNRYSRAMRTLGKLFFSQSELSKAAECYSLALAVNPLYPESWFTLGCAYMHMNDLSAAAEAFRKMVVIDDKSAEGWNNLGACYIKLGKVEEAYIAISHGIRFDRENWRMWENILILSLKLGKLTTCFESIRALIKLGHTSILDQDVFEALNSYSTQGEFTAQIAKLYDEVVSQISVSGLTWMKYADFVDLHNGEIEGFNLDKVLDLRIKACRTEMKIGWDKDHSLCNSLLPMFDLLAQSYAQSSESKRFEGRMFLTNVYAKINALLGTSHSFQQF